jgi:hypothetical protein
VLIKKHGANWPKGVPGDEIDRHFENKPLGYCEMLQVEIKGKQMFIHCMKEEKYVTKFMSNFGMVDKVPSHKTRHTTAEGSVFCSPDLVSLHNKVKHWVNDHNQMRHSPFNIAESWKTQWWPHHQFAFFLVISETVCFLLGNIRDKCCKFLGASEGGDGGTSAEISEDIGNAYAGKHP